MSYSADEVMVGTQRINKDGGKFEAPDGWRIVDVQPIGSNVVFVVMVKS